jgi:hypothetical protein
MSLNSVRVSGTTFVSNSGGNSNSLGEDIGSGAGALAVGLWAYSMDYPIDHCSLLVEHCLFANNTGDRCSRICSVCSFCSEFGDILLSAQAASSTALSAPGVVRALSFSS